jgi:hypothetical protein
MFDPIATTSSFSMTPDFITTSDPLLADNFTFLSVLNANANGETNLQGSDPVKISTTFWTTTEPNFSTQVSTTIPTEAVSVTTEAAERKLKSSLPYDYFYDIEERR